MSRQQTMVFVLTRYYFALNSKTSKTTFNGNINRVTFRSGAAEINNVYLDFWTNDGKRTTLEFYSDSGIQLSKDDVVIWTINGK